MKKRALGLSSFGRQNWKDRWFELTDGELSYWDRFGGAKDGATKKGSIQTALIAHVEKVTTEAFDRSAVLQVGYEDDVKGSVVLYIQASDDVARDDWLSHIRHVAGKSPLPKTLRYHPSVWEGKAWQCCKNAVKTNRGCERTYFSENAAKPAAAAAAAAPGAGPVNAAQPSKRTGHSPSSSARTAPAVITVPTQYKHHSGRDSIGSGTSPGKGGAIDGRQSSRRRRHSSNTSAEAAAFPAAAAAAAVGGDDAAATRRYKIVALYPYTPTQEGDLQLAQGDVLDVLSDDEPNWWKAQRADGAIGFVPANYVVKQGLSSEPWFHGKMGRAEAAAQLRMAAFSGAFLVRESESKKGEYSLSVSFESTLKHYHIKKQNKEFFVNDRHRFSSIVELVEYHKHNSGGLITRLRKAVSDGQAPPTAGFGHNQWEIPKEDIKLGQLLGEGNWGRVHLGTYKKNNQLVAVKTMKNSGSVEQQEDFIAEAKVMMQCSHPHLVQLYGVSSTPPLYIVTEFMKNGCLLDYLKDHQSELESDLDTLTMMGVDVASGMSFLEDRQFIHRDLAARNCLVGEDKVVKVADFGLARFVLDDEYTASEGTKFPVKWAAPEVINYNRFSTKSDVWSFGIILWEIWSLGCKPYPGMDNLTVMDEVSDGYRMARPLLASHDLHDTMMDCWHSNPDCRPSFAELHERLSRGDTAYAREEDLI